MGENVRVDEGDACQWHASHRTTEPTGETIRPYGPTESFISLVGADVLIGPYQTVTAPPGKRKPQREIPNEGDRKTNPAYQTAGGVLLLINRAYFTSRDLPVISLGWARPMASSMVGMMSHRRPSARPLQGAFTAQKGTRLVVWAV